MCEAKGIQTHGSLSLKACSREQGVATKIAASNSILRTQSCGYNLTLKSLNKFEQQHQRILVRSCCSASCFKKSNERLHLVRTNTVALEFQLHRCRRSRKAQLARRIAEITSTDLPLLTGLHQWITLTRGVINLSSRTSSGCLCRMPWHSTAAMPFCS